MQITWLIVWLRIWMLNIGLYSAKITLLCVACSSNTNSIPRFDYSVSIEITIKKIGRKMAFNSEQNCVPFDTFKLKMCEMISPFSNFNRTNLCVEKGEKKNVLKRFSSAYHKTKYLKRQTIEKAKYFCHPMMMMQFDGWNNKWRGILR